MGKSKRRRKVTRPERVPVPEWLTGDDRPDVPKQAGPAGEEPAGKVSVGMASVPASAAPRETSHGDSASHSDAPPGDPEIGDGGTAAALGEPTHPVRLVPVGVATVLSAAQTGELPRIVAPRAADPSERDTHDTHVGDEDHSADDGHNAAGGGRAASGGDHEAAGSDHEPTDHGPDGEDRAVGTAQVRAVAAPSDGKSRDRRGPGAGPGRKPAAKAAPKKTAKSSRKRRHRSPVWAKLLIGFGSIVMLASLGAMVLVEATLDKVNRSVTQENLLGNAAAPVFGGSAIDGPINFLLVGVDTRPQPGWPSHSDTIIMAHIPATHDRVYLISIPRDTDARIPADPKTGFSGGRYKINAAFTGGSQNGGGEAGGFQLLAQTIKKQWGITFNGGAIVNFSGFQDIVQKLGGVSMYIDETTVSIHRGHLTDDPSKPAAPYDINPDSGVPQCHNGYTFNNNPLKCAKPGVTPVVYQQGYRHLSPADALDFVRARDGLLGTDYARQRHQQQFIKAVIQEAYDQGLSDPFKLNSFIESIGKAFVFDGGGTSLRDWIFTLKGITPGSIITIKTNNGQFFNVPAPDSRQGLLPDSVALFAAVRGDTFGTDKVGDFINAHPDWVAQS